MKKIQNKLVVSLLITAMALLSLGCGSDGSSDSGGSGSVLLGRKADGAKAQETKAVYLVKAFGNYLGKAFGIRAAHAAEPLENFSMRITCIVGGSNTTGKMGNFYWPYGSTFDDLIDQFGGNQAAIEEEWSNMVVDANNRGIVKKVPITAFNISIGSHKALAAGEMNNICDFVNFQIELFLKDHVSTIDLGPTMNPAYGINMCGNSPHLIFIDNTAVTSIRYFNSNGDGETFSSGGENFTALKAILKDELSQDLYNKAIMIPFEGIDLTRDFDLKLEWDLSILTEAINDAGGNYEDILSADATLEKFAQSLRLYADYR